MQSFVPGQRVISDAELQNGLGTVLAVEGRTLQVMFEAIDETRMYAMQSAPLTRVAFAVGDHVSRQDGVQIRIDEVREFDGLLVYVGRDPGGRLVELPEAELDHAMQLNRPSERLFNGQVDDASWFELRSRTRSEINRQAHSDLYGLTGGRTSLLPHQLYIAHEVANRFAPRVLLADEVGLGKTIEAGMILHQQLLTERARRVLIIVPETLVHQWLVEMLRRFNLHFRIFDESRFDDSGIDEEDSDSESVAADNPFLAEQLVLCSLDFLASDPARFQQCLRAEWDMMVVDEAHHLEWSPDQASLEYGLVERLAQSTPGVLLLTATPEQLGKQSHFARLRLLDPSRFHDYQAFLEEEASYEPVASVVEDLLEGKQLDQQDIALIESTFGEGDNQALLDSVLQQGTDGDEAARLELVEHLLDRHGTGRVLFRNTRAAVKGFPERELNATALELPEVYQRVYQAARGVQADLLLTPETLHEVLAEELGEEARWSTFDPRLPWLVDRLESLHPAKVLVIAAGAETALDIAWMLKHRAGIHAAVFHEGLSIVERDKAAAYFADHETGTQVLVCSEIGSEGRNFQFAHHLVLFDLPYNPDLLEQRIGRLDRIGQSETIRIHVPYFTGSAQQVMFDWYHGALDAFEHTCPAGHAVFVKVRDELDATLQDASADEALVAHSRALYEEMTESLHRGRDRLLEYNSCRMHIAEQLVSRARQQDERSGIHDYMEKVFDCFGVDSELHSENCLVIRPTEHMTHPFPGLNDDGLTITFDRDTALTFEDAQYLNWEHPLVRDAMDLVMMNESGNSSLVALKSKALPAGSMLLECIFVIEAASIESLQSWRYLPPTTVRVVLDQNGKDISDRLPHDNINRAAVNVDKATAAQVVKARLELLKTMHDRGAALAEKQVGDILAQAHQRADEMLNREVNRLTALKAVNPNVRDSEIAYYRQQLEALGTVIDSATLRLDAIRAIVIT